MYDEHVLLPCVYLLPSWEVVYVNHTILSRHNVTISILLMSIGLLKMWTLKIFLFYISGKWFSFNCRGVAETKQTTKRTRSASFRKLFFSQNAYRLSKPINIWASLWRQNCAFYLFIYIIVSIITKHPRAMYLTSRLMCSTVYSQSTWIHLV